MFLIIPYLRSVGKLNGGQALDLGCGEGEIATKLVENGYQVDAVDIKPQEIAGVNFIQGDIRDFKIKENFYDLIVARNVLPFLASRTEVENMVAKMYASLKQGGIMYFTLFGTRDPLVQTRPDMTFIDDFAPPSELIFKSESFGLGKVKTSGKYKIWHQYHFVVQKLNN